MAWQGQQHVQGFIYWNASGNNVAAYQCVSLADASEVAAAVAAGHGAAKVGNTVIVTPLSGGLPTRRVVGVTCDTQVPGREVSVAVLGIVEVMASAGVAADALVLPALAETRTKVQTPLTSLPMLQLPPGSNISLNYELLMADDTALTPQTTGSNVKYFPLGYALQAATAKYDVIPVQLATQEVWL